MFKTESVQTLTRFIAARAARSRELFVNCGRRFPFGVCFQQLAGVKPGFVEPKEFARSIGPCSFFPNRIKTSQGRFAICFLFQTQTLFKYSLIARMGRRVSVAIQSIVSVDGPLVALRV